MFNMRILLQKKLHSHVMARYLIKELFLYFFVSFLFFFMIFFVNQILLLAETILKQRVPLESVMRLIVYSLPGIIAQSAPFATLVGFLMCLGRLVSDNEVLILRACGLRYRVLLIPIILLGIIISLISFFVNDYLLPVGTLRFNRLRREIIRTNPAVELESNSVKRTNESTLVIGDVNKDFVSNLVIFDTDAEGNQRIIVSGNTVVNKASIPGILMRFEMQNSDVIFFNKSKKENYDALSADNLELNIFSSAFVNSSNRIAPREMTSLDLHNEIKNMQQDDSVNPRILNSYKLEYNKKFSIPFGSLFFAILAMPLALIFGKKEGQTIGLILGLIISVLYWTMTILGQIFGLRMGLSGFWTMWIPNIVIGISGFLLYFNLVRK